MDNFQFMNYWGMYQWKNFSKYKNNFWKALWSNLVRDKAHKNKNKFWDGERKIIVLTKLYFFLFLKKNSLYNIRTKRVYETYFVLKVRMDSIPDSSYFVELATSYFSLNRISLNVCTTLFHSVVRVKHIIHNRKIFTPFTRSVESLNSNDTIGWKQ